MKYKTRGNASPQGKPRVYFTGHPMDVEKHFETITDAILKLHNCAIFYDEDPEHPEDGENFISDLDRMQLIVVVVTGRYVYGDTFAHNTVFRHAMERHIPVLPILEEGGIERDFDKKCGDLQYLDPNAKDDTAISFEEKLKKFLDSVLVGDELAAKVRAAFDAYVFLSYRKKDRRYAQQLMRLIHQNPFCRDIAIWYDEFLVPGEDFNDAIRKAMEKSELFALVVTPNLLEASNYIMSTEYPAARESGKPILPAMLVPTDNGELAARYENIPKPVDPGEEGALSAALRNILAGVIKPENDDEPRHIFFIGLAYLGGIDVEVNYEFAVQLITQAAEAGLPEAMEKLVAMYRNGEGVERDYRAAIRWQERLAEVYRAAYKDNQTEDKGQRWFNALWDLGNFWYELQQLAQARKAYHDTLEAGRTLDEAYHADWTRRNLSISYDHLGDICHDQGNLPGAKDFYEKSLAIRERLVAETGTIEAQRELFISYDRLGNICRTQGDLAGARALFEKSLAISERLAAETGTVQARQDLPLSYNSLGTISREQGDLAGAKVLYEKAHAIRERLVAETDTIEAQRDLSISYDRLGDICRAQGDLAGAKVFYEKCLAICERLTAETNTLDARRELAASYGKLGNISREQGDTVGAKGFYEKSRAINEQLAAETDTVDAWRELSISYDHLGDICHDQDDLTGAKDLYEKAHAICERLAAETGTVLARQDLAISYGRLGDICRLQRDLTGAKALYEKRLAICERLAAETDIVQARRDLALNYVQLGDIIRAQGDLAGAKDLYEKCLAISERLAAETGDLGMRQDLFASYDRMGDINCAQGDLIEAKAFYEKCLAVLEQLAVEMSTVGAWQDLSACHHKLGGISRAQGDLAGARAFHEKGLAIRVLLAEKYGIAGIYGDLAASCYNMAMVANTAEEKQTYLYRAETIWRRLADQYPDESLYKELLALVRQHIK